MGLSSNHRPVARALSRLCVLVLAAAVSLSLAACKSDTEKVTETVTQFMGGYDALAHPREDEGGKDAGKPAESGVPDPQFGDDATTARLDEFGIDAGEYHAHLLSHFSYQMGDVSVAEDGKTATVTVSVTNATLSDAIAGAASDFEAWMLTDEMQATLDSGGRAALVDKLFDFLYQRLGAEDATCATADAMLSLTKGDDGRWVIDTPLPGGFFSALYGGTDIS
ncbi:MAG: hypothetical protein MR611_01900 [Coriobacteriaceae bacterium]|nr:hypothetical protein [Coriobacteriaceae bacterium]